MHAFIVLVSLCVTLVDSQSLRFLQPSYTLRWNDQTSSDVQLEFISGGPLAQNVDISCQKNIVVAATVDSNFSFDSETAGGTFAAGTFTAGSDITSDDGPIRVNIDWSTNGRPGGFSQISCQATWVNLTASTLVQIAFPPKLSINPHVIHLPRVDTSQDISENDYFVEVGLTENPTDSVRIRCTQTNITPGDLSVSFEDVYLIANNASQLFAYTKFRVTNYAVPQQATFTCSAVSNNTIQYVESTSGFNEATLMVPDLSLSIKPVTPVVRSRRATAFLQLNQAFANTQTFLCHVFSQNESDYDGLVSGVRQTCSTVVNRETDWKLSDGSTTVSFPANTRMRPVSIENQGFVVGRDTLLLYCCGTGVNNGISAETTLYVDYRKSPVGQEATVGDNFVFEETPIDDPQWVDPAKCPCDVTGNKCDINCCCDEECTVETRRTFTCLGGSFGGDHFDDSEYNCEKSEASNPIACVYKNQTNWIGYYYPDVSTIRSATNSIFTRAQNEFQIPVSESPDYATQDTNVYTQGDPIVGHFVKNNEASSISNYNIYQYLTFPSAVLDKPCVGSSNVRFLKDSSALCAITHTRSSCEDPDSPLNALNYLLDPERTYPTPLEYFVPSDVEVSNLFYCTNSQDELESYLDNRDNLPPACWFSTQNVLPNSPQFEIGFCRNAVIGATYKIRWNGFRVSSIEASYVLGTIPVSDDSYSAPVSTARVMTGFSPVTQRSDFNNGGAITTISNPAELDVTYTVDVQPITQHFQVTFQHEDSVGVDVDVRSGNPGYLNGKSLRAAQAVLDDQDEVVSLEPFSGLLFARPSQTGSCDSLRSEPIGFMNNLTTQCLYETTISDFDNCTSLAANVLDIFNLYGQGGIYVAKKGDSDYGELSEWVEFIQDSQNPAVWGSLAEWIRDTLETEDMTTETPVVSNENDTEVRYNGTIDLLQQRPGVCHNIPSGIHIEFITTDAGSYNGVLQIEILGARLKVKHSTWELDCIRPGKASICKSGSTETTRFLVELSVNFFSFENPTNKPKKTLSRLLRDRRENCETNDVCWENIFYPLVNADSNDRREFLVFQENLGFTLAIGAFTIFIWKFTSPWTSRV